MNATPQTAEKPSYDALAALVVQLKAENQWLKEQFNLSRANRFGTAKETLSQTSLFGEEVKEEANPEMQVIPAHQRKKKKNKKGRNIDTRALERETITHDLTEPEKQCSCGCQLELIGSERTEKIDFIPPKLKVIEQVELK